MSVTGGDAEFIVGSFVAETNEFDARVHIQIDEIAIGRRAGNSAKYPYAAIVGVRHPIDLLFEDRPTSDVPGQQKGRAAARRRSDIPFDANR